MGSLPTLIARIARRVARNFQLRIVRLVRTHGQQIVMPGRLEDAVETAARKTSSTGREDTDEFTAGDLHRDQSKPRYLSLPTMAPSLIVDAPSGHIRYARVSLPRVRST